MEKENSHISAEHTQVKLSAHDETEDEKDPTVRWWYGVLLGFGMKLGGCTIAWNYGLKVGFWEYLIAIFIMGFAYLNQGLCLAELMSIVPFPGGYYGYSRCALGPFFGYLVGCCGVLESTFQLCVSVLKISQYITTVAHIDDAWEPLWWLLCFIAMIAIHAIAAKGVWYWLLSVIVACLGLVLVYLLGSIPNLDTYQYALQQNVSILAENPDPVAFFNSLRLTMLFFIGYDMVTLTTGEIIQPRQAMPKIILSLVGGLFIFAIWIFLSVTSQSPGITLSLYRPATFFPLAFGYEQMFSISYPTALTLSFLPSVATILAYSYVVGRQISAMSKSGLFPQFLQQSFGESRIPLNAMIVTGGFGMLGLWFCKFVDPYTALSRVSTLVGCCNYLALFACYYVFSTKYSNMERQFVNPFGWYSILYGCIVYGTILITIFFLNPQFYLIPCFFVAYLVLMTVYYYLYVEQHQCFSAMEQKYFFKAYVVNAKKRQHQGVVIRIMHDLCWYCYEIGLLQHHSILPSHGDSHGSGGTGTHGQNTNTHTHPHTNNHTNGHNTHPHMKSHGHTVPHHHPPPPTKTTSTTHHDLAQTISQHPSNAITVQPNNASFSSSVSSSTHHVTFHDNKVTPIEPNNPPANLAEETPGTARSVELIQLQPQTQPQPEHELQTQLLQQPTSTLTSSIPPSSLIDDVESALSPAMETHSMHHHSEAKENGLESTLPPVLQQVQAIHNLLSIV